MAPPVTPVEITMTVLTTITLLTSSIYGSSTVSFVNDILAQTPIDLDLLKLTEINSWCGSFTVNPVF
jgi:hypothetical protein